jgi:hypothetical protein
MLPAQWSQMATDDLAALSPAQWAALATDDRCRWTEQRSRVATDDLVALDHERIGQVSAWQRLIMR